MDNVLYILPRPGSVSLWSSKATDIAKICNLGAYMECIEWGITFMFTARDALPVTMEDVSTFQHLIHDHMTQVIRTKALDDLSVLCEYFSHHSPNPLGYVNFYSSFQNFGSSLAIETTCSKLLTINKAII